MAALPLVSDDGFNIRKLYRRIFHEINANDPLNVSIFSIVADLNRYPKAFNIHEINCYHKYGNRR